jgi:YVTN family beta-propeller protein
MRLIKIILPALFVLCFATSCNPDDPWNSDKSGYLHGAFITNEGAFGNSNGSISFLDPDSSAAVNHLFEMVNGRPLGDVVQSFGIAGEKGFIVVNNSQKVEVVDLSTFESIGFITGLEYPRYFLAVSSDKAYLSDGNFTGRILVVDIASHSITDTIPCGMGPEHMIQHKNHLIVANSGGWGNDSTLTVIDTKTDKVIATWKTGHNPTDLVIDRDDNLWVLCKGEVVWDGWNIAFESASSLWVGDPGTGEKIREIPIGAVGDFYWPQALGIDAKGRNIYYLEAEGLFSIGYQSENASKTPMIAKSFYGFGVDTETGRVYGMSAPSFTAAGWLFRYEPDGQLVDSIEVGIGPNRVVFN